MKHEEYEIKKPASGVLSRYGLDTKGIMKRASFIARTKSLLLNKTKDR
jgi:hypothetical protein